MASVFRKKKKEPLFDSGPEAFNLLMKEAFVREFLDEQENVDLSWASLTLATSTTDFTRTKTKAAG